VAVLDTFFLLFEADTKPLEKGGKKAEQITDDIDDNLKATEKETQSLGESFGSLAVKAAGAFASLMAVQKIAGSVLMAGEQAIELELMSNALGANAAEVSAWSGVVESATGDADSFTSSMSAFNDKLRQLELAGGVGDLLNVVHSIDEGIQLMTGDKAGSAMSFLDDMANGLRRLAETQGEYVAIARGAELGFDRNMVLTLLEGEEAVEAMLEKQKELNIADEKFIKISQELQTALQGGGRALTIIAQALGKLVLPAVTAVVEGFTALVVFMKNNERLIKSFFTVLAAGAAIMSGIFLKSIFASVAGLSGMLVPALIMGTASAITFAASMIAASLPIIGIIAGIVLLLAAVEDLYAFFEGEPSFFGDLFNYLGRVPQAFEDMVIKPIKEKWDKLKSFFGLGAKVDVDADNNNKEDKSTSNKDKNSPPERGARKQRSMIANAQNAIGSASNNPLASQTSNSMSISRSNASRQSNVNINTIEVNTQATDAEAVNGAIVGTLENQIQQAQDQYQDGVDT